MSNQPNLTLNKPNIEVAEFSIDGLADLLANEGADFDFDSPEFSCFGHHWWLSVYPGDRPGYVAVYIHNESDESIEVQCTFIVDGSTSKPAAYCKEATHVYEPGDGWGVSNFAERTVLLGALRQGALVIKVEMRKGVLELPSSSEPEPFVPETPHAKSILKSKSCDRRSGACNKRVRFAYTKSNAHKLDLSWSCSTKSTPITCLLLCMTSVIWWFILLLWCLCPCVRCYL